MFQNPSKKPPQKPLKKLKMNFLREEILKLSRSHSMEKITVSEFFEKQFISRKRLLPPEEIVPRLVEKSFEGEIEGEIEGEAEVAGENKCVLHRCFTPAIPKKHLCMFDIVRLNLRGIISDTPEFLNLRENITEQYTQAIRLRNRYLLIIMEIYSSFMGKEISFCYNQSPVIWPENELDNTLFQELRNETERRVVQRLKNYHEIFGRFLILFWLFRELDYLRDSVFDQKNIYFENVLYPFTPIFLSGDLLEFKKHFEISSEDIQDRKEQLKDKEPKIDQTIRFFRRLNYEQKRLGIPDEECPRYSCRDCEDEEEYRISTKCGVLSRMKTLERVYTSFFLKEQGLLLFLPTVLTEIEMAPLSGAPLNEGPEEFLDPKLLEASERFKKEMSIREASSLKIVSEIVSEIINKI